MLTRLFAYLRGLTSRRRANAEAGDELAFHLDHEIQANVARGMAPAEARRRALADLGGLTQTTEAVRGVRTTWLDAMWRDARHTMRRFRREPGFFVAAVAILAIGIGACTAMFSVVQSVLLRPIGVHDPDRVVMLWPEHEGTTGEMSFNTYRRMRERLQSFDDIAVLGSVNWSATFTLPGADPFTVPYSAVSATFFNVLGARPLLGRTFTPEDDELSAPRVLVLSHATWVHRFGADPDAIGRLVTVDTGVADRFEIVGVMPPDLFFPRGAAMWTPAGPSLAQFARQNDTAIEPLLEGLGVFFGIGRLAPSVSIAGADAEMEPFLMAHAADLGIDLDLSVFGFRLTPLVDHIFGTARPALLLLMSAVVIVLLLACTNVGGLLLARGAARTREMAVRAALGASRTALVRQLLIESGLLVAGGTVLGVAAAVLTLDVLVGLSPADIPRLDATAIDVGVLLFAVTLAAVSTLVLGAVPAWQLSQPSFVQDLRGSSTGVTARPSHARSRGALVGFQIAATLVLLAAAGLCVQSFARLTQLDLGFNPSNVLTFSVAGLDAKHSDAVDRVLTRIAHVPHVAAVSAVNLRPFEHGPIGWDTAFLLEGQLDTQESWGRNPMLNVQVVTPGYFQTMRIRLVEGRDFEPADIATSPLVAIVSEAMAARVWPGVDPIGRRLRTSLLNDGETTELWITVVGVAATARYREIDTPRLDFYVPYRQSDIGVQHFMVRTDVDPGRVVPALRTEIDELDSTLSVGSVMTMEQIVRRTRGPWQFNMIVFGLFSTAALGLAGIGLFGLVAYSVAQRTREVGVRMALGARPPDVVRLMLVQAVKPVVAGLIAGAVGAVLTTRLLSSLLFEVSPTDPATFAGAVLLLVLIAATAIYLPARRAARVNPVIAMRSE